MVSQLNATLGLLSTLLTSSMINVKPMTDFDYKNKNPNELTHEKLNHTIELLSEAMGSMKSNGKSVQAFVMGQFKDILEHLGDQMDIIKTHSDDDETTYKYLQYTQYAINVLESYANKYKKFH
jgi:hypothetical protein